MLPPQGVAARGRRKEKSPEPPESRRKKVETMLSPKRTKFRKYQKGKSRQNGVESNLTELEFGRYGLKPGQILYEMDGIPASLARRAADLAAQKLPVKTAFLSTESHSLL